MIFCQNQKTPLLQQGRGRFFGPEQTSEEGDLLFLVRIKPEQVEKRVSWILRANLPAGWLGIESVEIWQQEGGDEEIWKLFGLIKKNSENKNMEALRFDKNFLVKI